MHVFLKPIVSDPWKSYFFIYLASFPGSFVSGHTQEMSSFTWLLTLLISSLYNLSHALNFLLPLTIEFYSISHFSVALRM